VSPTPASRSIPFTEVTTTSRARHDTGATLVVGTSDASRATIERLVPSATVSAGRVMVAVFQGEQRTGGYAIRVSAIERRGDQILVRATFSAPGPGAIVTQALTSPAHVVSIAAADATGLRDGVLLDETGTERARVTIT